ncbi:MAG: 23S rRNA (adenine(2503)-C(2))-methyltransferase RlmN [Planctomycetota bacterium]
MDCFALGCEEWRAWAVARGLPAFRGQQIHAAVQAGRARRFADIRTLPAALRSSLDAGFALAPADEALRRESRDGTIKSLLRLRDGAEIECVSIPTAQRHTVCVSTQAGCAIGCSFCASGAGGLRRDLSAGEMVFQVLHHQRRRPVTNVVFMGSGEPFLNYEAVLRCVAVLGDPAGLGLGRRRLTVSTVGVPDRIRAFAHDEPQVNLAVSLHAVDDATRSALIPANRSWPLAAIRSALRDYSDASGRRVTLEYCLIDGINTAPEQAVALARWARPLGALINLICYNAGGAGAHRAPDGATLAAFAEAVASAGGTATLRASRGTDIAGACGELSGS